MAIPVFGEIGVLPQENDATTPTLAFGDGDTGFYESADDVLYVSVAGAARMAFTASSFDSVSSSGPRIANLNTSATAPSLAPNKTDADTGIGSAGADQLSLIAGGAEGVRVDTDSTAGNTRFMLYDVDNATLERVTVGAADSGGSGFKVLRIPN